MPIEIQNGMLGLEMYPLSRLPLILRQARSPHTLQRVPAKKEKKREARMRRWKWGAGGGRRGGAKLSRDSASPEPAPPVRAVCGERDAPVRGDTAAPTLPAWPAFRTGTGTMHAGECAWATTECGMGEGSSCLAGLLACWLAGLDECTK